MTDKRRRKRSDAHVWYTTPYKRGKHRHVHQRPDCFVLAATTPQPIDPKDAKGIPPCRWCFPDQV